MDYIDKMSVRQLKNLCSEIREYLIKTVPHTGGHLASNLGTVELTAALHKVFDCPRDKIVFDVGHQAYTHKILTGRFGKFAALRSKELSGFPRPSESECDAFIGGHSGIAVSAALGIAEAMRLKGDKSKTIAVVGDGSFTDGGTYEGLNNAGKSGANLLVILNDNEMSISKNTGAIANYLAHLRATKGYYKAKTGVKTLLQKNKAGEAVTEAVSGAKKFVKNIIYSNNLFENLGFRYYGPVDGHNLKDVIGVLELAKLINEPCFIHVKTKKGKGYSPAEKNSGMYHGLEKTKTKNNNKNNNKNGRLTYSEVFGREISALGEKDGRICLISAAMKYATGCDKFAAKFPERFFDAGIAEGHAATFAAGLASIGMIPVFAVYSTFCQRSFDRLLHDCAIENLHVVLAVDRAGVVGEDGETHQGLFDVGMFGLIPNFTVFSPSNAEELSRCLYRAVYEVKGPVAVRYPRGAVDAYNHRENGLYERGESGDYHLHKTGSDRLAVTYGRIANRLRGKDDLLQLVKIMPLSEGVMDVISEYEEIEFIEEAYEGGGIWQTVAAKLLERGWTGTFSHKAYKDFVPAADTESQLKDLLES